MEGFSIETSASPDSSTASSADRIIAVDTDALFEKAKKLAETNSMLVAVAGNSISLLALFILKEMLVQQAQDPVTNLNNIISISDAIATLNANLTVYAVARP